MALVFAWVSPLPKLLASSGVQPSASVQVAADTSEVPSGACGRGLPVGRL